MVRSWTLGAYSLSYAFGCHAWCYCLFVRLKYKSFYCVAVEHTVLRCRMWLCMSHSLLMIWHYYSFCMFGSQRRRKKTKTKRTRKNTIHAIKITIEKKKRMKSEKKVLDFYYYSWWFPFLVIEPLLLRSSFWSVSRLCNLKF